MIDEIKSYSTQNGRLKELLKLASTPAKNTKELSATLSALALVVVDIHLEISRMAGRRQSTLELILYRVVAPLLVGVLLWLFVDFGPAILRVVNNP